MELLKELLIILKEIKEELKSQNRGSGNNPVAEDPPMTIEQAAQLLQLSKQTIYGLMSRKSKKRFPHHKTGHKTIYFFRNELIEWAKGKR